MKLKPVGFKLYVKLLDIEEFVNVPKALADVGFEVAQEDNATTIRTKMSLDVGRVVAIGPLCWKHADYGYGTSDWAPWAQIGDKVVFGRYAGKLVEDPVDGEEYMLLNDEDIQSVIEE